MREIENERTKTEINLAAQAVGRSQGARAERRLKQREAAREERKERRRAMRVERA